MFERVLVDIGDQKLVFTIGKPGILWKLDRRNGQFLGYKETLFQNVFESIDPKTGAPTYRGDILEQQTGQWVRFVPEHRRRPQLAGDELRAVERRRSIIPLSQSCMEMSGRKIEATNGSGGTGADRRFFEMPGSDGNVGKLAAYRRQDDEGAVDARSAVAVPDRRASPPTAASASSAISIAPSARST